MACPTKATPSVTEGVRQRQVCGTNRQLNYKAIIKELHAAIRHLYTDRVIPHLHSCLNEIITTALLRYEQMGLIEIPGFNDKEGVRTNFIQSGEKNRPKVMETLNILKDFRQFSARELKSVIEEITVRRINVLEPDGTIRMVISGTQDAPGLYYHNKEHPHLSGQRPAGIYFMNDEGTEAGGIIVSGNKKEDGRPFSMVHFSMDNYDQDQAQGRPRQGRDWNDQHRDRNQDQGQDLQI